MAKSRRTRKAGGGSPVRRIAAFLLLVLLSALIFLAPTLLRRPVPVPDAEAEARVTAVLPEGLDHTRRSFVLTACSLVGRVGYFWGGKSDALGWDSRWGAPAVVTAEGGSDTGAILPFGLDCSGYVSWTAVNAAEHTDALNVIGSGVRDQWAKCRPVTASEARSGDLAFFPDLSHVGIVAGREADGTLLVLHCSRTLGGVVLSPDAEAIGFTLFGDPDYYLLYGDTMP